MPLLDLVFHGLTEFVLDLIPKKARRFVGGVFMGIGGVVFLMGLAMMGFLGPASFSDSDSFFFFSGIFVAGIGFVAGLVGATVWYH
jgi:hypothetical protein